MFWTFAVRRRAGWLTLAGVAVGALAGAALAGPSGSPPTPASLGRTIFHDASLSASGSVSCASCHVPASAHAQADDGAVQSGGADLNVAGFRAVPSLRYMNFDLPFFFDKEGTPTGGFNRDGRADDLIEQARRPFLAPHEMANPDAASVAGKLSRASYAGDFRRVFGADIFADAQTTFLAALFSLASYEASARELRPFDSKFDLFLRGRAMLSTPELRGLALFNRADKGNCAGCHPSTRQADGSPPVFTDYTYDNLGVPRNAQIAANADPDYFDLGLCGPDRTDLAERRDLCGQFKVPTLRNVATRKVWFHNGNFHSLKDALHFYVERDTNPERWYPAGTDGTPDKFNDLPPALRGNVNTQEAPYDRHVGQAPALSDAEIDDVIAFLNTLTDGYDAASGTADPARDVESP
jgi:cytochrome c peroxidase